MILYKKSKQKEREARAVDTLATILGWFFALAMAAVVVAMTAYVYHWGWTLGPARADWAAFGEFVGGTLNPVFSFVSMMALLLTVMLQRQQISMSRQELDESRVEIEATRQDAALARTTQLAMSETMGRQAHYAMISARAVALGAALEAANQQVKASMFANQGGFDANQGAHYAVIAAHRDRLAADLLDLTNNLAEPSATATAPRY